MRGGAQDALQREMEELKSALASEKHANSAKIAELERSAIAEKNRLKKEMLKKVKETKLRCATART